MRPVRFVTPVVVATLLWWASAGLQLFDRQHLSGSVSHYFDLIAPQTVSVQDATSPAPWAFVMTALSLLAFAGAYAALLALVRRRTAGKTTAASFAAYWFCAVLAGGIVAVVPVVAELTTALAHGTTPSGLAVDLFSGASYWGLPWGWIPALAAVLLDAGVGRDWTAVGRRIVAIPAAVLFLVAAVGIGIAEPHADAARQAAIPSGPVPIPVSTGKPVPEVAPGSWQIDPLWCTSGQLEYSAGEVQVATGHRAITMQVTNSSDAACVLDGYPDVAFGGAKASAIVVDVDHGGTTLGGDPGATRFELQPAQSAYSTLGWGAMPTQGLDAAGWLHIAAYSGAKRQQVQIASDITGGTVSVTAWSPAPPQ